MTDFRRFAQYDKKESENKEMKNDYDNESAARSRSDHLARDFFLILFTLFSFHCSHGKPMYHAWVQDWDREERSTDPTENSSRRNGLTFKTRVSAKNWCVVLKFRLLFVLKILTSVDIADEANFSSRENDTRTFRAAGAEGAAPFFGKYQREVPKSSLWCWEIGTEISHGCACTTQVPVVV